MKMRLYGQVILIGLAIAGAVFLANCSGKSSAQTATADPIRDNALKMVDDGKNTFRFDTFGDEAFWGDTIKLHLAIAGAANGGVGTGVSPATALSVGLKVDLDALPGDLVAKLQNSQVDLNDPATTLTLLKLNAVVGVTGRFNADGSIKSMGIQCALCHSIVDNSFTAPGIPAGNIGHRLDGWANRDLNVGVIINLAPDLTAVTALLGVDEVTVRKVLTNWGAGKFDAQLFLDRKAANSSGVLGSSATLIPPAFGLAGVNLHTSTGFGSVTYWNGFVANLEMHGKGTFFDPRLNDAVKFPVAAAAGSGNVRQSTPEGDMITGKLAALHFYQLAIPAPTPPEGSFVKDAAARGKILFDGKGKCATCHVPPLFTEPGWNMHTAAEIGIDDFQAQRSPDVRYRTTPLKGLWAHAKGGFYHDGRYATMLAVVNHYNTDLPAPMGPLGLTAAEMGDLVEYLKSL